MSLKYINEQHKLNGKSFREQVNSFKFTLFLLYKLPSAFFSGVRIIILSEDECKVKVPYKWFSQNPFNSTYFACLAMAGEMSTGLPALMAIHKLKPRFSMLVVDFRANFTKKATDITTFTCTDIAAIYDAVYQASKTKEGETVTVKTLGKNKAGEEVATFNVTWSFKSK